VHIFHRMRKEGTLLLHIQENPWQNYSQKLSIISKHIKLIPKELRYQEKIHAISDMPREKKNPPTSPQFYYFFFLKKKNKKNNHAIWK
jgi:hypothetical protein